MRSATPKVLHPVAGQSLLAHVLGAAPKGSSASLAVVIGPDHQAVEQEAKRVRPDAATFVQRERLGTAHAVLAARDAIARGADDLLIAFGDTPLISAATFERLRAPLEERRSACRARLSRRRSHRLRPAPGRGRPVGGDPRAGRRQPRGTRDHTLQCRRDGLRRPQGARNHREDRQCQQQARILFDRRGDNRSGPGIGGRCDRNQRG